MLLTRAFFHLIGFIAYPMGFQSFGFYHDLRKQTFPIGPREFGNGFRGALGRGHVYLIPSSLIWGRANLRTFSIPILSPRTRPGQVSGRLGAVDGLVFVFKPLGETRFGFQSGVAGFHIP